MEERQVTPRLTDEPKPMPTPQVYVAVGFKTDAVTRSVFKMLAETGLPWSEVQQYLSSAQCEYKALYDGEWLMIFESDFGMFYNEYADAPNTWSIEDGSFFIPRRVVNDAEAEDAV